MTLFDIQSYFNDPAIYRNRACLQLTTLYDSQETIYLVCETIIRVKHCLLFVGNQTPCYYYYQRTTGYNTVKITETEGWPCFCYTEAWQKDSDLLNTLQRSPQKIFFLSSLLYMHGYLL